jgi:hypothetical protein
LGCPLFNVAEEDVADEEDVVAFLAPLDPEPRSWRPLPPTSMATSPPAAPSNHASSFIISSIDRFQISWRLFVAKGHERFAKKFQKSKTE